MIDFGYGVYLDTLDARYKDILRHARNNYSVWKTCRQNDLISEHSHDCWFESIKNDPTIRMYALIGDSKLVGVAGFTSIDFSVGKAEFSYYTLPQEMRKGYGLKALKTLFAHGFQNLNLNLIWGECIQPNPALKMFLKLGMHHEGKRRSFYYKNGKYRDADLVSMLRSEWHG